MLRQNVMRLIGRASFVATVAIAVVVLANRTYAVPLLAVDFGTSENYVQSGFSEMAGTVGQSTANATFGTYSVGLAAVLADPNQTSSRGFNASTGTNSAAIAQSVRPLYRDYFYNDSDISGDGVALTIDGVTPNLAYNLTLWSYDGDQSFSSTNTAWSPLSGGNTTGSSGSVTNFATPRPTTLSDNSTTIQVTSTTSTLEIFGTFTSGFGGTRLNGFRLNDGVTNVLSVDMGKPSPPPSPVQSGFQNMSGTFPLGPNSPPPSATATFGSYTVKVSGDPYQSTDYTRVGFEDNAASASGIDPSIRALYEDGLNNNLDTNTGAGLNLSIQGVVPNAKYALKVWSYNPDNTIYSTPTQFSPLSGSNTTGTSASITQFANPLPTSLNDSSTTIYVSSTTNTLDIHAASTANFGGTRLNGFTLTLAGDYNGDNRVDAADYVVWRKTDGTQAGYDAWRSNFGASLGAGSGSLSESAVPEPSSLMTLMFGVLLCGKQRRFMRRPTKRGAVR
jgi:PEP-CTERM motif